MLVTKTVQEYWSENSDKFESYYSAPNKFDLIFRKGIYIRVDTAIKVCRELNDATILDIGSGPGINSVSLIKKGNAKYVTGIDFSDEMVSLAKIFSKRESVENKCQFILGDFLDYKTDNGKVDMTLALGVFDYIKDSQPFIDKMWGLTSKKMVISWPEHGLRMLLRKLRYKCHVYGYTKNEIIQLHKNIGIESLKLVPAPGGWISIASR